MKQAIALEQMIVKVCMFNGSSGFCCGHAFSLPIFHSNILQKKISHHNELCVFVILHFHCLEASSQYDTGGASVVSVANVTGEIIKVTGYREVGVVLNKTF